MYMFMVCTSTFYTLRKRISFGRALSVPSCYKNRALEPILRLLHLKTTTGTHSNFKPKIAEDKQIFWTQQKGF
jgi:hypothetical protein